MRANEFIVESKKELDEDWKSALGNLGLASVIGLGGGAGLKAYDALKGVDQPTMQTVQVKPQIQQKIQKPTVKSTINQYQQQPQQTQKQQQLSDNPLETILLNVARKNGMHGAELAAFLAQCAHESADFTRMVERGNSKYFNRYDPKYAPGKAKILGNTKVGDGAKYKGRGYIQLTGRDNYHRAGKALGLDLINHPEYVEDPEIAAKVAVWFWKTHVKPKVQNFKDVKQVTKPINPKLRGLEDRKQNFKDYYSQVASLS